MANLCQSCSMPMNKDPKGGGTHADGSLNTDYCSLCFESGHFFNPQFTAQDMQDRCIEKMKEQGVPRFLGWILTRNIPKLKRWHAQ